MNPDGNSHIRAYLEPFQTQDYKPFFSALDIRIAEVTLRKWAESLDPEQKFWAAWTFALAHRATRSGNIFVDLDQLESSDQSMQSPDPNPGFRESLQTQFKNDLNGNPESPIYWDAPQRIYVRKFFELESQLAREFFNLARSKSHNSGAPFAAPDNRLSEEQQQVVESVLSRKLTLLNGGPGTGKTSTTQQLLKAIFRKNSEARVSFLAPTGKAVARLQNSVGIPATEQGHQVSIQTIHRFLQETGSSGDYSLVPRFPTQPDYLVVDEVSMVDVSLMHKLLMALPSTCHILLMGDIHQLASVQPGAVFSDVFNSLNENSDCTLELTKNFRFERSSTVMELCQSIKSAEFERLKSHLFNDSPQVQFLDHENPDLVRSMDAWIEQTVLTALQLSNPSKALARAQSSMLLCALNKGKWGVEHFNSWIRNKCAQYFRKTTQTHFWMPIMVLENDYNLQLFNGDFGLLKQEVSDQPTHSEICYFEREDGSQLEVPATSLPRFQPAYATTIHKSQGSEADDVLIILPPEDSPLLTRELLYTAFSRTRDHLTVVGNLEGLKTCINRPTQRNSRLAERIEALFAEE